MASRLSRRIRPILAAAVALGAAALLLPTVAAATPNTPASPPSVETVQKRLGALALENTQLVEKYDQAQVEVDAKQKAANAALREATSALQAFEQARAEMGATIAAQYEGGSFSATGALLSSSNGQSYLDQLNTLGIISAHTARVVEQLATTKQSADTTQQKAAALLKTATAKRDALAKQKSAVQAQVDKYTTLLATLTAAQRAAFQRSLVPEVSSTAVTTATMTSATSAAATRAVKFALAQVGKPYVFGAAGPDTYDCSGLTMAAWATGGVALPHSAADQYNYGTHVSLNSLEPGDLIFFYQPIGHVTIYIGNGLMVSAPETGENVSVVPLASFSSDVTGATRLVG